MEASLCLLVTGSRYCSFREMSATFEPRLDILPDSQRRLWPELDAIPSDFVLYGGTGLALQLGHRASEDFDFFSSLGFDPDRLRSRLPFFRDLDPTDPDAWVHRKRDNLEAFVNRGGAVKIAFFGGLDTLQRVEDPRRAMGSRVRVASLLDLAGMKMRVIQVRANWKDYVDIHTLASHGIDIPTGLGAATSFPVVASNVSKLPSVPVNWTRSGSPKAALATAS